MSDPKPAPAPYTVTETVESAAAAYRESATAGTNWSDAMLAVLSKPPAPAPKIRKQLEIRYCRICGRPDCTCRDAVWVTKLVDV
jgi:hypothetical protein